MNVSITSKEVRTALAREEHDERDLSVLLSDAASEQLETMARRALQLTRRHFGRTIQLYAPLYLSSYCPGGCVYCGFAGDRDVPRHRLSPEEVDMEVSALKDMGLDEILLLTGERCPEADFDYVRECVRIAAKYMSNVNIEVFPMETAEYRALREAGCTGLTLYQETYDRERYSALHRWGPKSDYANRRESPSRALAGGLRFAGLGVLLGLADPVHDLSALFCHVRELQHRYWRAGITVSFPRIRPQKGGYQPAFTVSDRFLAQAVYAFRICLPDVPLVLSTRERPDFRDGMAGVGISKMSVASRTTVGGYSRSVRHSEGQFEVSDDRNVEVFCRMLREKELEPVFKNWDAVYTTGGQRAE